MADTPRARSPLWMIVLSLAAEEPMHPYRMQVLIKERGKDMVANVSQRNSIYQTITALKRSGLIAVRETSRDERRPERTVYEATAAGRRALTVWIDDALSVPAREYPDFPAALSLVAALSPDHVRARLDERFRALEGRLIELDFVPVGLPRVFLLENEYQAALVRAELKWLAAVSADLKSKKLTWSEALVRKVAAEMAARDAEGGSGEETVAARRRKAKAR